MIWLVLILLALCFIIFIYKIYHEKIMILNVKIKNVKEKINSTLLKRKELIKESEDLIKEITNTNKVIYDGLDSLNKNNIPMMQLDKMLLVYINEFYLIKDKYLKLEKNEEFQNILFAINETEDLLNAYKEYYNDTIEVYNKIIRRFPIIIISFLKKRKQKEFFDKKSMKDNDYNDFKY